MNDEVDFVIIWVDGNDINWQRERDKYANVKNGSSGDNRKIRYRDWDNLQYWFRGVEKYAPWVNKVYFVTWGHIPEWLNIDNPKLNIVKHDEYIPKKYLPTFNSNVIELNLHRIVGLSEKFVYFNDDMFICDYVKKEDFFKHGLPCDSGIMSPIIQENKNGIGTTVANNLGIINQYFEKNTQVKNKILNWFNPCYGIQNLKNVFLMPWNDFCGFYEIHIASSFLKSTYQKLWKIEADELDNTSKHKFRNVKQDLNQWVIRDWQLASNNFIPRNSNFGINFNLAKEFDKAIKSIEKQKYKMICLNDSDDINNFEEAREIIKKCFNKILPEKSSFEK